LDNSQNDGGKTVLTHEWYVVHTYSGYENKVKANLLKTVENRGLQEIIREIRVPVEEMVEVRNGKKKTVQRKVYPGYVLINMINTPESWYIVRNTRGVTGFVGPGSDPTPLTLEDVEAMGTVRTALQIDVSVGENIRIVSGPLEGFIGTVQEIDYDLASLRVMVSMFGRETPIDLNFDQIEKL